MKILPRVLGDLAAQHVAMVLSEQRDCRLIFPGLTESLAVELHEELRRRVAARDDGGASAIPVYLALDYPETRFEPDKAKGWLHYEAVTSVRQGSFITVCMPKVLPKLHDSIRGTGSPIRGLTFTDEWPWKDVGVEAFRFRGPVLNTILEMWTADAVGRDWIRELVLEGLLPATAPLRDAIRVPLLLEEILSFEPALYPDLDDVVDKFCFHCGIPKAESPEKVSPAEYVDAVETTAKAFDEQRTKNSRFRDYLVNEVAVTTFAALEPDSLQQLKSSLDLLLDGALELGTDSGVLAYRGGLGKGSSSASVDAWSAWDVDRLRRLFGIGESDVLQCTALVPERNGVVSTDGKHAAIFEGSPVALRVAVKIGTDRFVSGKFQIQCKRRQRQIYARDCDEAEFQSTIIIPPNELPGGRSRLSLVVQLVRFQQVEREARVYVHVCGAARPGMGIFEPGFDVVDLLESQRDPIDTESVMLTCREPIRVHLLDWEATDACRVTADDEMLPLEIAEQAVSGESGPIRYILREAIDVERFSGARVDLHIEASGLERDVTLSGEDIEPGEFTLEDELRVATATGSTSRVRRVLPFFEGHGDLVLPKLGELDGASRRRIDLGREFEKPDGWKPVLVDFVEASAIQNYERVPQAFFRTSGRSQAFLREMEPTRAFVDVLGRYSNCRDMVIEMARNYVEKYATPSDRPLYVAAPNYVARDDVVIEAAISQYLETYSAVLNLLGDGSLSPGEVFTLVHLDSVVLERASADDKMLDLRVSLLGPWHPLVVAKRFMVQHWIFAAAEGNDRVAKKHRRLACLFERVEGFRVNPGFDTDSLSLDVSFAFPMSDPGWHLAVASSAFSAIARSTFGSLGGLGEQIRSSLGLRSSLYLSGADLWSESFVRSFQRSHPSRRQIGLRVSRGLDEGPVVDSCSRLLVDERVRSGRLGALLSGGIHLFLEGRLDQRQQLPWQQPPVVVYEELDEARCYEKFSPDILLVPQREEVRLAWFPPRSGGDLNVPRGRDRGAVFSIPLVELAADRDGVPESRVHESGEAGAAGCRVAEGGNESRLPTLGEGYGRALGLIDTLAMQVRPQRPTFVQKLGLPPSLRCDWTVLPGAQVDAGALAKYVAGRGAGGEERALWDYRLDIGESVRSYFIVCKVPKSVLASLTGGRSLALGPEEASSALRELAEVGFAVGETMRSGKAAVGVLGVVGALRLARAAWAAGEADGRRWCTVLLPVDCITDLLVAPLDADTTSKRTDLLGINLAWAIEGPPRLTISPFAVECKYVSGTYTASAVKDALGQAKATYEVVSQLLSLAKSDGGMHARLAFCHILRFGLRLLSARGDVTMADEQVVLDATLSGSFGLLPPIAPSLLVTTSCGANGEGAVDVREDGWWVQLTADCWPREVPSLSDPLVRQLSKLFAEVESHVDDGSTKGGGGTYTSNPNTSAGIRVVRRSAGQEDRAPATARHHTDDDTERSSRAKAPDVPHKSDEREAVAEARPSENLIHPVFQGFVGNRAAVEVLSIQLRYVEQTGTRSIRSVGLFGPKSTGKTELSRRLASALGVPYLPLSETSLRDIDQLADRMQECAREGGTPMTVADHQGGQVVLSSPPMLVFIDEVHQLTARVQDTLLPVLEADDRMLRGSQVIINAQEVSFVIATTDWGKLREAFHSRVRAVMLEPYNTDEVAQMLRFRIDAASRGHGTVADVDPEVSRLSEDALVAIATAARAVPRVALDLLREVGMALRIRICGPGVDAVWGHLQTMVPCDRQGLTSRDRKYLRIVANRGPIGLDNIAMELGIDRSNVERSVEPFLAQMGWVQRGSTGRTLTTSGKRLVARFLHSDE